MGHRTTILFVLVLATISSAGQQTPVWENYFLDKYSLSPSFAGQTDPGTIFTGFRSDWTGIPGGPKTYSVSYSDLLNTKTGLGFRVIYDRAGIFDQLYLMGSYSYALILSEEHKLLFGISAGLYRNGINFTDHYNDPGYNIDPVLTQQDIKSHLKIISDYSLVYLFKGMEAGLMFSNITFGDAKFSELEVTYKPFAVYQVHAGYTLKFNDFWSVDPLIYIRGGKYIKCQTGLASRIVYKDLIWASLGYRDHGIWGTGVGVSISKWLRFSYNFNMASSVSMNIFNSHEFTIAINIKEFLRKGANYQVSTIPDEKLF